MGSRGTEVDGQPAADSTPEDVAVLYSWANLQGAKYRDYSASRREYRAQVRYRAAKALLERELKAQEEAEASAAEAESLAQAAETSAHAQSGSPVTRLQSRRIAEAAARNAAAERVEAARRAETAAHAAVMALREEREIVDAHSSAKRKELIYEESEQRRRELAGPQPRIARNGAVANAPAQPRDSGERQDNLQDSLRTRLPGSTELRPASSVSISGLPHWGRSFAPESTDETMAPLLAPLTAQELQRVAAEADATEFEPAGPAWLYASQTPPQARTLQPISPAHKADLPAGDTLQDSRERVAARWFALKGVFENSGLELPAMQSIRPDSARTRLLAVFSLAGGVGKTSLVATLGRVLSSQGERVVLADTTPHGLLPIYFGLHELRPGELRTISPPADTSAMPISVAACDIAGKGESERQQEIATDEILRNGQGSQRLLLDLASGSSWLLHRMVDLHPVVLVPLAPDMNSVLSLQAVEKLFRTITDSDGRPLLPFYVLNQFDATLPLHLDVREVLRRQLGDRLLRIAIRRSPAVSEALAEGMTVVDYVPDAPVSQDYLDVASWLRSVSPPAAAESRSVLRGRQ